MLNGLTNLTNGLSVTGNAALGNGLSVLGFTNLADINITGLTNLKGLTSDGPVSLLGNTEVNVLTASGDSTFVNLEATGDTTLNNLEVTGTTQLNSLTVTGTTNLGKVSGGAGWVIAMPCNAAATDWLASKACALHWPSSCESPAWLPVRILPALILTLLHLPFCLPSADGDQLQRQ